MYRIDQDIKSGKIKNLYLLYGKERYLLLQYKNKLLKALSASDDNMNYCHFDGKDVNPTAIIDFAETMPFFADYRVIYINGSGFGKSIPDKLGDYLLNIPSTAVIIFVEEEVDKRGKLYKAAKSLDSDIEFVMPNDFTINKWIASRLNSSGKNITNEALTLFKEFTGADMGNMDKELEKLISYMGEEYAITPEHVRAICTEQLSSKIFVLVDALVRRDKKTALSLYYDMIALKEPAAKILFMITKQYNILLQLKEMQAIGYNADAMAPVVGLSSYIVSKNLKQAQGLDSPTIRRIVERAVDYDTRVKSGKIADNYAVELLINECCKDR